MTTPVRILIVEDNRVVARDIQNHLTKIGYAVPGMTSQGEEAIRLADELRPDLVLMDIRLESDMDGIEAAQTIRSRFQIPVVFLTAYADEETLQRAKVTEPFGYILKPFEERELRTVIEMALYKHEAERRLRESEHRFAITLSSIGDAVIATNSQAMITFMNPVAERLTGWRQIEAANRPLDEIFRIINEATRMPADDPVDKVLRSGNVVGLANHTVLVGREGHEVPIDDCGAPIIDDNGAVLGAVLVFHDVTDQRRSQEALSLFRALLDRTNDSIEVVDPATGRFLDVNETACQVHGYTREEYLNLSVPEIEGSEGDWSTIVNKLGDIRKTRFAILERQHRRKDGSTFPVEINVTFIHLDRPYLVAVVRDITERKKAEESLRQAEEKYRGIFDNAVDGIFQSTPQGRFLTVNSTMARMLGYSSPSELIASIKDIGQQLYVDHERRAEYARLIEERRVVQGFECQFLRKDGTMIWVSLSTRAVPDSLGGIQYYEGIVEEITERKRLEEQLLQSQRMEAIGQLAGGVAHDFNNHLTIILGYSDLLANAQPQESSRALIKEIQKAGQRGAALTRQLLAFSRKQVLAPQVLGFNALVVDMEKMLRRLIGEHITLKTFLEPRLGRVKADPGQIDQVIMNLAVNARDAMPRGGILTLATANVELKEDDVRDCPEFRPGSFVKLSVTDTGIGMSPEIQARIFEPFFTTKEMGKGTGLGLASVYGIVKQSEGWITVKSQLGQGACFEVFLPRVFESPSGRKTESGPFLRHGGVETILVVEDEDAVRRLAAQSLQADGYTVLQAANAEEALLASHSHPGSIDLLLTDIVMPGMSGSELAEKLIAQRPMIKVLYVTGYTENPLLTSEEPDPNKAVMQKPFRPNELCLKVREALGRAK